MKIILLIVLLLFSSQKYFDNSIDFKIKEYVFDTYKIITKEKKILAELKNCELILKEERNKLNWNFLCNYFAYNYYPYNHRQYFKIKIIDKKNNFYFIKIKFFIHCDSKNISFNFRGNIYNNLKLKDIKDIQIQIIPKIWFKCNFI